MWQSWFWDKKIVNGFVNFFLFFKNLLCMYSLLSASLQKQQVCSGVDQQTSVPGSQQTLTVMVQGQGQTSGQLQVIPQGVTVIPGPGQQLMQAALPSGQMQRFLFTPMASAATPTPSTGMMTLLKTWICHLRTNWLNSLTQKFEYMPWRYALK